MMYDVAIIGGGPAGMTAAIYAKRAGKSVIIFEKEYGLGGQMNYAPRIQNFPSYTEISGMDLSKKMQEQIVANDVVIEYTSINKIVVNDDTSYTLIGDTCKFLSKTVIIATGAKHREIEELSLYNNISYCALCDGQFYKNKSVAVIGGGNSALQEAIYLSNICSDVTIIHRRDKLRADGSLILEAKKHDNVHFILNATIKNYIPYTNGDVGSIVYNLGGQDCAVMIDGIFVAIGIIPNTEIKFNPYLNISDNGYSCQSDLSVYRGLFVAGDCRDKEIRQITTACSEGAIAATNACNYLNDGRIFI